VVSAPRSPASVPSPTQATYPSGRINTAAVEIGHPTTEQRVSLPEVVVDVQTGDHPGEPPASLVDAQQVGDGVARGVGRASARASTVCAMVCSSTRAATGWPLGVIGVAQDFW
jgi:hypothetical protein